MQLNFLHWRLTTLFHATIITQTIALIFSQIDQNKIQRHLPIGHFLFTFPLLWKYKTDFLLLQIYHNGLQLRIVRSFTVCPGGYSLEVLVGVCCPHLQIQTQFQTKKCHFPHPFSDLASKIHTRFQT